ncbi:PAS domain-containing sensor histidine kinase [Nostoc sp. FACHB-280]|uniref:PAS domain-containing sensor histidine kinase n=1 Tax=Nostoc sp. FACHB-280 TaxID=2692839 RepID=UPI00168ACD27|nr:PAS domain-containing sensor histidine kinase [Nostoc sp. FACHB-280]MBD2497251.1 HAMP domain-containing histidine kinase [Nostoc sp. FACHB-280]
MQTDGYTLVCSISRVALKPQLELTFVGQDWEFNYIFRCQSDEIVELNMHTLIEELKEINKHLQQEVFTLKQKESDLEKSVVLLRSILESTAYGMIAISLEADIVSVNQQFIEMWQVPNSLTISKNSLPCRAFLENQLKQPQLLRDSMWEMKCDFTGDRYDILELKDGRFFAQYSKPQRLEEKIIGRVWSIWDISELSQAVEKSQKLSELRSQLLSMVSHQLRTPLNVVSFSNSLLTKHIHEWTSDKTLPLLGRIQTAVEQMSKMLDDILLFTKAETAKLHIEAKPLNLVQFCHEMVAQIRTCNSQNKVNFDSQGSCFTTFVDRKLLAPILKNLLDNAIKYSPSGGVVDLQLFCEPEKVIFQVADRGIGIPVTDQQRLFEPFYRGSNIAHLPGTGLGLSIVKTLVDLHGGHIDVKSEIGVGTTFTVILPSMK